MTCGPVVKRAGVVLCCALQTVAALTDEPSGHIIPAPARFARRRGMKKQASHSTSASPERSRQIEVRYLAYALAVSGTALVTAPAKAEIVYTPTNVSTQNGTIFVDLNNDGISDLKLYDMCTLCTSSVQ